MNELGRKLDDEFIYASDEDRYNLVRQRADAGEDVSILVLLIFAAGAAWGAVSSIHLGNRAIWIAAALLAAGFALMFVKEEER